MGKWASTITVILSVGAVALTYNACSDVKFATYNSSDVVQPLCTTSALEHCARKETVTIVRAPTSEVDILLIVDDSDSMIADREKLGEKMKTFTDRLSGLDWQICYTTTSPASSIQGKILDFSNGQKVLKSNSTGASGDVDGDGTIDFNDVLLESLVAITTTSGNEQGIAAAGYTIKNTENNCFRNMAALSVVLISDEDERSAGGWADTKSSDQWRELKSDNYPSFVFDALQTRFNDDQKPFTYHSIVIKNNDTACADMQDEYEVFYGRRYEEMSRQSGGIIGDICAADYGVELTGFADRIKKTLQAVTLECAPVGDPVVTISSGIQPYTVVGNKIVFANQIAAGTVVTVKYYCGQ